MSNFETLGKIDNFIKTEKQISLKYDLSSEMNRLGVKQFTPEAREALLEAGFKTTILLGKPWEIYGDTFPSARTEAATFSGIVLPSSGNKTAPEQEELISIMSETLSQKIPGVELRLGSLGETYEAMMQHLILFGNLPFAGVTLRTNEPKTGGEAFTYTETHYKNASVVVKRPRFLRSPQIIKGMAKVPYEVQKSGISPVVGSGIEVSADRNYLPWALEGPETYRRATKRRPTTYRGEVVDYDFKPTDELRVNRKSEHILVLPLIFPASLK